MSLEHTLMERPDVVSFLAESEPPPMSEALREATAEVARELAGAWSHGALPPGVELGPYTIQGPLGQGGQATVYRAKDEEGQSFAIKVPRQELLARLVREAQIHVHLDHPRVVRIVTADVNSRPPYLVTEHLSGGTLEDVLQAAPGSRLDPERVRGLGLAVLDALAYAHEKGVIHRDLKPSNILFDATGEAKVADFGIGSLSLVTRLEGTLVSHDRTGIAGTPLYMAPEQELAGAKVDGRADLYAVGKVVYRALTGRSPRTIRPLRRVLPDLDQAWEDFILNLVEDDPRERYPSAQQARAVLAELPLGDPSQGPPVEQAYTVMPQRALVQLPPSDSPDAASPEAERAPWATGYVVDQVLAVVERFAGSGRGTLFAFVPQPWKPSPGLGIRIGERSLAQLEDVLAIEPLGIAIRGRTIRATFDPRGADSRQAWVEAALAGYVGETVSAQENSPSEVFLVGPKEALVAKAGSGIGDWLPLARAVQAGEDPSGRWISVGVDEDHFLLAEVRGPQHQKHRGFERLGWLARRIAEVLKPGDTWRTTSPSPGFDANLRNLVALDLAGKGALVLHLEPSGRSLVYQGEGVQSTRSLPYLRRLLEGGLGLLTEAPEQLEPAKTQPRWRLPLGVSSTAFVGLLLISPKLSPVDLGLGVCACLGLGAFANMGLGSRVWGLRTRGALVRQALILALLLTVIGITISLILAALG